MTKEKSIRTYNLCLLGLGNVNRALLRLLKRKDRELRERGIGWQVTGVASRNLGWRADSDGLDVEALSCRNSSGVFTPDGVRDWLEAARADLLFEATALSPVDGQPAIGYIRTALDAQAHVITANKGPIVHAYRELSSLAAVKGRRFLFEATVMDGAPLFSLFQECLPTVNLRGFRGILNSTTNVILGGMEEGFSFGESLKKAQQIGVAETDPSHDVDGWDAAVKVAALITVLMGIPIGLNDIAREGIGKLTMDEVREARGSGTPYKLVCRAQRSGNTVTASVSPERLPLSDPLAWVAGTSSIVYFETDIFAGLAITENNPGVEATAYGMLADFIRAVS